MATSKRSDKPGDDFDQDPLVQRLRPDPSAPPSDVLVLEGLAGRSTQDAYARLYFNTALNFYAEFRREDIVYTEAIPAEQPPFVGQKATRVALRQDAVVEYTRTARARPQDALELEIRRPGRRLAPVVQLEPATIGIECPTQPFGCVTDQTCGCHTGRTDCVCPTDNTCRTDCGQATCDTCRTQCGGATCATCNQATCNTCQTQCGQATCQTCNQATCQTCDTCQTACGQATCNTCRTDCGGGTCVTCDTCNPHVFTCGGGHGCF